MVFSERRRLPPFLQQQNKDVVIDIFFFPFTLVPYPELREDCFVRLWGLWDGWKDVWIYFLGGTVCDCTSTPHISWSLRWSSVILSTKIMPNLWSYWLHFKRGRQKKDESLRFLWFLAKCRRYVVMWSSVVFFFLSLNDMLLSGYELFLVHTFRMNHICTSSRYWSGKWPAFLWRPKVLRRRLLWPPTAVILTHWSGGSYVFWVSYVTREGKHQFPSLYFMSSYFPIPVFIGVELFKTQKGGPCLSGLSLPQLAAVNPFNPHSRCSCWLVPIFWFFPLVPSCLLFFLTQVSTPSASLPPPSSPMQDKWWLGTRPLISWQPASQTTRPWAASHRCSTSQSIEPAQETHTWCCPLASPSPPKMRRSAFTRLSTRW